MPAALSAIRGSLAAAPVPAVLENALAANALNALADEPPTELATLSPESGKWQPRGKTVEGTNSGSFAPMHGNSTSADKVKRAANQAAGKAAFKRVKDTHQDAIGAMERDSIGKIDFIWGNKNEGVRHILRKHKKDMGRLPGVIAHGDVYESRTEAKFLIIRGRYLVVLRKREKGNHYLITGYRKDNPRTLAKIRKEAKLVEKGG